MTTDFPTAADIIVQTASQRLGKIDGAIQIDPYGLSGLLKLTGPVRVEGWPEPVTSANLPKIAQHDMYIRFLETDPRDAFGERVISAVFGKFLASSVRPRIGNLRGLGDAIGQGHIKVFSTDPAAQQELAAAGIDGGLRAEGATDVLGVFNQNAAGNKIDWFLRRSIHYEIRPGPDPDTKLGILTVELNNQAPASGLPKYIIGPIDEGYAPGENRTILTVIRPLGSRLLTVSTGGRSSLATIDQDKDLRAHQVRLSIPPGGRETVEMVFVLDRSVLVDYRFKRVHQPAVIRDECALSIDEVSTDSLSSKC
jgi:hypothetical protein